jgi:hypothetical protein
VREQHGPAIGKLNGVVVRTWIIQVDLPEPPDPMRDVPRFSFEKAQKKSGLLSLDIAVECDLGARKKAHRHLWAPNFGESMRCRVPKFRRDQPVSDLCGS